ncbi:galactose mutarotase-like protein [Macrolepiota fuliginosa MF-IS2]|uniref:Galactose mutarotase-like protein n=1 Tax=Macrolepiota fuliginosa MF-IS2 TaxID=1400762 RepID=A0A9P6C0S5_9AGAR|nr:galactose mutarotase-like protein [Macrolepiota fuliginosa MF-IS2]
MRNFARLGSILTYVAFIAAADYPFDVTEINAPDGSISAKFVSLGATLTELWVKDKNGKARDVVLGYDDNTKLLTDPIHPVFNAIVGRYANRMKNGTFSIPITKDAQPPGPGVYQIPTNDHNGEVTLHSGPYGWDRRNFTLLSHTHSSATYKIVDNPGTGFPGGVTAYVTHAASNNGIFKTSIRAYATEQTPIMLTQHIYWNLDAFQDDVNDILGHHLQLDASRVVHLDGDAVPYGDFIKAPGTIFDFKQSRVIGDRWNETVNLCGSGCQGFDHEWIYDHSENVKIGTSLWGQKSGIKLDISTNQPGVQVYTADGLNVPRKEVHGGPSLAYGSWAAVAIEQQGYVDAINTPEWGVDQIYGPGRNFTWSTTYKFSIVH